MAGDNLKADGSMPLHTKESIFLILLCIIFGGALFLQLDYGGVPLIWNVLFCTGALSFLCMAFDKKLAVNEMEYRVPNALLLATAVLSGGVPSYVCRKLLKHKTAGDRHARTFAVAEIVGLGSSAAMLIFL